MTPKSIYIIILLIAFSAKGFSQSGVSISAGAGIPFGEFAKKPDISQGVDFSEKGAASFTRTVGLSFGYPIILGNRFQYIAPYIEADCIYDRTNKKFQKQLAETNVDYKVSGYYNIPIMLGAAYNIEGVGFIAALGANIFHKPDDGPLTQLNHYKNTCNLASKFCLTYDYCGSIIVTFRLSYYLFSPLKIENITTNKSTRMSASTLTLDAVIKIGDCCP